MKVSHPEWRERTYPDKQPRNGINLLENILDKLKQRHPDWPDNHYPVKIKGEWKSSRQWYNPRRWQLVARKLHEEDIKNHKRKGMIIDKSPEALGVNITGLMANIGVKMNWQWPPKHDINNKTYLIAIAGRPKK